MASDLLYTFTLSMSIQAVFFVFAASLKTDKVTDLSYGLTFPILASVLLFRHPAGMPAVVLTWMVVTWGARLAAYLLYRIIHMKRDARFDGVREHFWKFFQFWFFQGVAVWVIMLPVTLWFRAPAPWTWPMGMGLAVWMAGLAIETVADAQKFTFKRDGGRDRWMSSGLWRYSRHPNYFGELLCWWGVFVYVMPALSGWSWLGVIGPVAITCLLLFITGIPTLEASARRKWGGDPEYQAYRKRTSRLVPMPVRQDQGL
jgi:steroid 5-alpha reductase family enzyme